MYGDNFWTEPAPGTVAPLQTGLTLPVEPGVGPVGGSVTRFATVPGALAYDTSEGPSPVSEANLTPLVVFGSLIGMAYMAIDYTHRKKREWVRRRRRG